MFFSQTLEQISGTNISFGKNQVPPKKKNPINSKSLVEFRLVWGHVILFCKLLVFCIAVVFPPFLDASTDPGRAVQPTSLAALTGGM